MSKQAVFIVERLGEAAFEAYMSLTVENRKDPAQVKDLLVKRFDRPKRNREVVYP